MARHALGYLSIPEIARRYSTAGPLLLMDDMEAARPRVTSAGPARR
jgi:hypothetical protein